MATRIKACTFGTLEHQPWAGELQRGEGSCVRSLILEGCLRRDLKRILETMHLGRRDAGDGASHSDEEEVVGREGHTTRRLRSDAQLFCVCFIPMFAIPRLTDAQLLRKDQQRVGAGGGRGGGVL